MKRMQEKKDTQSSIRLSGKSLKLIQDSLDNLSMIKAMRKDIKETRKLIQQHQFSQSDMREVSYVVIQNNSSSGILQSLSQLIDVQLQEDGHTFPFVEYDGFSNSLRKNKIFITGYSGAGKTRSIYEILQERLANIERIIVIYPKSTAGFQIQRNEIRMVVKELGKKDAIIWDNFPDDLLQRSSEDLSDVLNIITSNNVGNVIVALKPAYLQQYSLLPNDIPDISALKINYGIGQMKKFLELYGTRIRRFNGLNNRLSRTIDEISQILWTKQPLPITAKVFYESFWMKPTGDEVYLAKDLPIVNDYYAEQFERLTSDKPDYADFLYILKLCYLLGKKRDLSSVEQLQKIIFGSLPPKMPVKELGLWTFIEEGRPEYSVHDAILDAIVFHKDALIRIANFVLQYPKEIESYTLDSGTFVGNIFSFSSIYDRIQLLKILSPIINIHEFGYGFGYSIGEIIWNLDDSTIKNIFDLSKRRESLALGLGNKIGKNFLKSLSRTDTIIEIAKRDETFASAFARGIDDIFPDLPENLQLKLCSFAQVNKNFESGFGRMSRNFHRLSAKVQGHIIQLAKQSIDFLYSFLFRIGDCFHLLSDDMKQNILSLTKNNENLTIHLAFGIGEAFHQYDSKTVHQVLAYAQNDYEFASAVANSLVYDFHLLNEDLQRLVFQQLDKIEGFDKGLGFGFGLYRFNSETCEMKKRIFDLVEKYPSFATGFGEGITVSLDEMVIEDKERIFELLTRNYAFSEGFGFGIGDNYLTMHYAFVDTAFALAEKNDHFAYGLGEGMGRTLEKQLNNKKLLKFARVNINYARGIGKAIAVNLWLKDDESQEKMIAFLKRNTHSREEFVSIVSHYMSRIEPRIRKKIARLFF